MSSDKYENVKDPTKIPIPAKGTINFKMLRSNTFLNLYTATTSEKIRIVKIIANA